MSLGSTTPATSNTGSTTAAAALVEEDEDSFGASETVQDCGNVCRGSR